MERRKRPNLRKNKNCRFFLNLLKKKDEYDNPILLLDDALGREIALLQKCNITGTLGIIIKAREIGLLNRVRPYFEKLKEAGFYISEKLFNDMLDLVNE